MFFTLTYGILNLFFGINWTFWYDNEYLVLFVSIDGYLGMLYIKILTSKCF